MGLPVPKPKPSVLLTRPRAQSERFAQDLRGQGFSGEIVISPLLKIKATGQITGLEQAAGVIFTSRNAVECLPAMSKTAWCVGRKTAERARQKGWDAKSADGDVETLFQLILRAKPQGRLVHLRGTHSRGALVARLQDSGFDAEEMVVYQQLFQPLNSKALSLLSGETPVIVPLFSPRSAALFAKSAPFAAPVYGVAMSEAVRQEMQDVTTRQMLVAAAPNAVSMQKSVLSLTEAA